MHKVCSELQKLPREVRNKLFDNADGDSHLMERDSEAHISQILSSAFDWISSSEGAPYWIEVFKKYGAKYE